jgi:hypothetical protein
LTVFGVRRLPGRPYSSARPSSWQQVGVCRACVYMRRTLVALDTFFVVHTEVRRLCADVRPHLGRRRDRTFLSIAPLSSLWSGTERRVRNVVFVGVAGAGVTGPRMPWQNGVTYSNALDTRQAAPTLPLCPTSPGDPPSSSQLPLLCLTLTLPPPRQIISN